MTVPRIPVGTEASADDTPYVVRRVRRSRLHEPPTVVPWSAWRLALCTLPATATALILGWTHRWVAEDGFIYLRVARNIAAGNGPVFNPGERVEVATGSVWVWLLAGLHQMGLRLEFAAVGLGLVCTLAAFATTQWASARWWRSRGSSTPWWLPAGVLLLALWPPMWTFVTSGLETSLALAWIGGAWAILAARPRREPGLWRGASEVAFLASSWFVRPDLALMGVVALVGWWWLRSGTGVRPRLLALAAGVAPVVAGQLLRMAYFAAVAPNPALAKEGTTVRLDRGVRYVIDATWGYGILIAIVVAVGALVALGRHRPSVETLPAWTITAAGLLHLGYVAAVGGDFMHARMAIPGVFAVLATWAALVPVHRATAVVLTVATAAAVAVALWVRPVHPKGVVDERAQWVNATGQPHPVTVEQYASAPIGPLARVVSSARLARDSVRAGDRGLWVLGADGPLLLRSPLTVHQPVALEVGNIGAAGFIAGEDVYVADKLGLAHPVVARLELTGRRKAGHEKEGEAWTSASLGIPPRLIAVANRLPLREVTAASEALQCGWVADLQQTVTREWSPSTALRSLLMAPSWWTARLPDDPVAAEEQLCE